MIVSLACGLLGASRRLLGAFCGLLVASWGRLGGFLGPLGRVLGPLGRVLGLLGRVLGASWGLLGASWARPGASWARPGGFLGPPGSLLSAWGGSQGGPEAENTVKLTYFHVFCRVSGGPRNRSPGLREGKFNWFWAWGGGLQEGGLQSPSLLVY